jgi:hypothetical protein
MSIWVNKSILKGSSLYNVKAILASRPKERSDEDWNEIVKDSKMNKLIVLNQVPKVSQKDRAPRKPERK